MDVFVRVKAALIGNTAVAVVEDLISLYSMMLTRKVENSAPRTLHLTSMVKSCIVLSLLRGILPFHYARDT